jgi:hypothetical protein
MTIATKSGGLILKDGKLATNCACCGDGICPCVANMPTAFAIRLKNIEVSFVGNFNTFSDFSGYENELIAFAEKYELIATRTAIFPGTGVRYQTGESCYPLSGSCAATASPCTDPSRYEYLNQIGSRLFVRCNETVTEVFVNLESAPPCWNQFPNNLTNRWLSVGILFWTTVLSFPPDGVLEYPFCDNPGLVLDEPVPENTAKPTTYHASARWRLGSSQQGIYEITGGSVEFTPIFDNPLP